MDGVGLDPTLRVLGGRSRYQLLQLLVINVGVWGAAFQLLDNIFIGRKVTWQQCAAPDNGTAMSADLKHVDWTSDHVIYGACEITITSDHQNQTFPCLFGYEYDYARHLSFRTEFDLVCGRSLLADLLQTLVIMGQACGAFVAPFVSDRYGRKGVLVWSQVGLLVVGVGIGVAPTYPLLATLKFAVGCLQQGVMTGKATMSIELFPSEFRSMTSLMMALMWMSGTCGMALTSFLLQDRSWRCLQCVLSAVSLLALLQMWYVDESLRWLLANGKKEAAARVLQRAARVNRQDVTLVMRALCGDVTGAHDVSCDLDLSQAVPHGPAPPPPTEKKTPDRLRPKRRKSRAHDEDGDPLVVGVGVPGADDPSCPEEEDPLLPVPDASFRQEALTVRDMVGERKPLQRLTLLHVLKHRRLRFYTLLVWATWFTCTFSAFSLYVMSTSLHGNRFLNFFLTASMKLPAGLLFFYMVDRQLTVRHALCAGVSDWSDGSDGHFRSHVSLHTRIIPNKHSTASAGLCVPCWPTRRDDRPFHDPSV
ncbi:organic cation transporter-like protein isoform X2 [Babylonia areolata]|uniref:organic cation transporter-like protein isoform X2 n=1 Tax=Babylonia areolata TaxID=304850 RepID=UPI003FD1F478